MTFFFHLKVGNTCMICPPTPDTYPTLTFPLPSVGMGGGIHHRDYPYRHSLQTFPQGLPVSYKGRTKECLQDRGARSHQLQVGEKASFTTPQSFILLTNIAIQTHSDVSFLNSQTRPIPIRGHSQGAGILYDENLSPPV